MVKTIPPLMISRAKRGTAPDQNVRTPSSLKILEAQTKLFLYSFLASMDCILARGLAHVFQTGRSALTASLLCPMAA